MPTLEYIYELRRGEEVVATGRLTRQETIDVGDRIEIAKREGVVRSVDPVLGEHGLRLVVQLVRADD